MGESMNRGRNLFNKHKKIINILVKLMSFLPIRLRKFLFTFFKNTEGILGIGIRYVLLRSICKNCGDNVSIFPNVIIYSPEKLSLGNNVSIHSMCYIDATGEVQIGNDVSIAHGTTILSSTHNYSKLSQPIKDQGMSFKKTILEDNVWIGAKATILCGLVVKTGTIVGANTILTKSFDKELILGGNPAKIIQNRRD